MGFTVRLPFNFDSRTSFNLLLSHHFRNFPPIFLFLNNFYHIDFLGNHYSASNIKRSLYLICSRLFGYLDSFQFRLLQWNFLTFTLVLTSDGACHQPRDVYNWESFMLRLKQRFSFIDHLQCIIIFFSSLQKVNFWILTSFLAHF